jgi:hypothetical protein
MMDRDTRPERAFLITDRYTNELRGICTGPVANGKCPYSLGFRVPCAGKCVTPLQGTNANGLPFTVPDASDDGCPMDWLSRPTGEESREET